ncbi:hypothetical protein G7K_4165-t1 [Saitoella complicata NRRL Y-17804]|uniref:Uncharacterized protein n=1 Tax=Saitoella complicata (strain BCRC 22490 / CBS 7301 / JCM 7358 / NBRC 10748 / NRRL Y-17804) TaxID=698492 RepID=A0A0E9NKU3_SAICN|nr:hypothetical protein G7K_4165-t1 [Saitoella complicata NRRL Y-17804]
MRIPIRGSQLNQRDGTYKGLRLKIIFIISPIDLHLPVRTVYRILGAKAFGVVSSSTALQVKCEADMRPGRKGVQLVPARLTEDFGRTAAGHCAMPRTTPQRQEDRDWIGLIRKPTD